MGFVERMKWWQWTLLSLGLGALLGYLNSGGADTPVNHSSASTVTFETAVVLKPWVDPKNSNYRRAYVSDIVVHPVQEVQVGAKTTKYQLISYTRFIAPDGDHPSGSSQIESLLAPFPYEPTPRSSASNGNRKYPAASAYRGVDGDSIKSLAAKYYPTDSAVGERAIINANPHLREAANKDELKIQPGRWYWIPWDPKDHHNISDFILAANDFLNARDGANAIPLTFHYRWWESQKYGFEIWMAGTFLIVGVLWPTLLTVMIKGGLGKMTAGEYDLSRFRGGPEPEAPKPATAPVATAADEARLRELEESLTASLKAGAAAAPVAETATAVAAPPEVKKLTGGPAEAAQAPKPVEEAKDYDGEFYPVAHPNKKPDEK
jgi:hypothetical protein